MELIDNITRLLGDDLKATLKHKSRLKIAASCFSMYAFEALKAELEKIDELSFIFTSPTFTASEVTDKIRKERKEFHIPKLDRERSLYGSEFEIQLRNKLIPTPVGDYNPDWAISFKDGAVKHVYFVAETKGSMSSMELREIERTKIKCARKFFDGINKKFAPEQVRYDVVDSFGKLMELVKS